MWICSTFSSLPLHLDEWFDGCLDIETMCLWATPPNNQSIVRPIRHYLLFLQKFTRATVGVFLFIACDVSTETYFRANTCAAQKLNKKEITTISKYRRLIELRIFFVCFTEIWISSYFFESYYQIKFWDKKINSSIILYMTLCKKVKILWVKIS